MRPNKLFCCVVIGAALVCVVGLLILPQVDPPDFVIKTAVNYTARSTRIAITFLLGAEALARGTSQAYSSNCSNTLRQLAILGYADTEPALSQICERRC
jgi:hypothetical protein